MNSVTPLLAAFWGWAILFAYWFIAAPFARKTKSSETAMQRWRHTIPTFAALYLIFSRDRYFLLAGKIYPTEWSNWIVYPGLLMTAIGLIIAIWARVHLGRYWSGLVMLKEGHKVIDTGPYRIVRHPIYTGWLLAALGSAIVAGTLDGFVGVELLAFAFILKSQREEKLLTTELGDEYRRYMQRVRSAIVPWISAVGSETGQTIQSEAFNQAALRSDRYRATGLLCICGAFVVYDCISILSGAGEPGFLTHALAFWACLAIYEVILLAITRHAQWQHAQVRPWVWAMNTIFECCLPALALLGLTAAKLYMGPYRALVSSSVLIYALFIILSTLRLSPALCVLAGFSSSISYVAIWLFTLHIAPNDVNRHFMPDLTYINYAMLLLGAGFVAAAVARQIRQHVIAALLEAETRRKLDRIEFDLKTARSIQMGLLPKRVPNVPGYDIAGWSEPADQTGGDYYDWIELPDGCVIVTIADASGHGIGPALLIAACRAYFRAITTRNDPLEQIMAQVDALLAADVPDGRFITAAIALLDPRKNELSLYSAGHAPIYHITADGKLDIFDADQPPLGIQSGLGDSRARIIPMSPGDSLVLVTDGFFECTNPAGEILGMGRLGEAIRDHRALSADKLIQHLCNRVKEFSHAAPQADDVTAVVIQRRHNAERTQNQNRPI